MRTMRNRYRRQIFMRETYATLAYVLILVGIFLMLGAPGVPR